MSDYPPKDTEFTDERIKSVRPCSDGNGWQITRYDGWSFFVPPESPIEPNPEMEVRFYGEGIGRPVRGLFLDGVKVFYRTEQEESERHRQWCADREREQKHDFEKNRAETDRRVAALPTVFQERLARFRANNPDFRWKYESYELFCCEQAVEIAKALGSADKVRAFKDLPWKDQQAAVPALSDGHSGNTFGCACALAYCYLVEPGNFQKMHGALAPLVGSQEYGCIPK